MCSAAFPESNQITPRAVAMLIRDNFPQFLVLPTDVTYAGEGMDTIVYRVIGGYMFRFAKNPGISDVNQREARLLPILQKSLSLRIPNIEYAGLQQNGLTFLGYQEIQGQPLTRGIVSALDATSRDVIVGQVVEFLKELRNFSTATAQKEGIVVRDLQKFVTKIWEEYRGGYSLHFDAREQKKLVTLCTKYLNDEENFAYKPCLVHADLGPEHILYDSESGKITGVIDWSDMIITDPAFEMQDLFQNYGEDFTRLVLLGIGERADYGIERARFFTIVRNLQRFMRRERKRDPRAPKNLAVVKEELAKA